MTKKIWRMIFWIGWSIGWILLNMVLAKKGVAIAKSGFVLVVDVITSCFAAYVMAISTFWMWIIAIAMIIGMFSTGGEIGIICFAYNLILVGVTKMLTPKKKPKKKK